MVVKPRLQDWKLVTAVPAPASEIDVTGPLAVPCETLVKTKWNCTEVIGSEPRSSALYTRVMQAGMVFVPPENCWFSSVSRSVGNAGAGVVVTGLGATLAALLTRGAAVLAAAVGAGGVDEADAADEADDEPPGTGVGDAVADGALTSERAAADACAVFRHAVAPPATTSTHAVT